jgi:DNA-binding MarR family transcriptional regulator
MTSDDAARRIAGECLAMRSRRVARTVTRLYDDALRPLGIGAAQLGLLVVIQRRAPVSPADIGRTLELEKSTLSRNLQRLRAARLIDERQDGRGKQLTLTPAGRRRLDDAYPLWRGAQRSALAALGEPLAAALSSQTP